MLHQIAIRRPGQKMTLCIACRACVNHRSEWKNEKRSSGLPFAIPLLWREPKGHGNDCYFCHANIQGITVKTWITLQYSDIPSAIRPLPQSDGLLVSVPLAEHKLNPDSDSNSTAIDDETSELIPCKQEALHSLIRYLNLCKENAKLLG